MLRRQRWLLLRWLGRQSLFAPITIAGVAFRQEAIRGIATHTTTEPLMGAFVETAVLCLDRAAITDS